MATITLRNDFHGSEVVLRVAPGQRLSDRQMRRAKRVLCGINGCTCSNALGMRGPNPVLVREGVDSYTGHDLVRRPRDDEDPEWLELSGWAF